MKGGLLPFSAGAKAIADFPKPAIRQEMVKFSRRMTGLRDKPAIRSPSWDGNDGTFITDLTTPLLLQCSEKSGPSSAPCSEIQCWSDGSVRPEWPSYPRAGSGTGPSAPVLRIRDPALFEGQASTSDAFRQPLAEASQLRGALIDPF